MKFRILEIIATSGFLTALECTKFVCTPKLWESHWWQHHLSYDDCLENKGRSQDCSCSTGSYHCIQCYAHILWAAPTGQTDLPLSHWVHFTVLRCVCVFVFSCISLHACCIIVTWWGGPGGIEAWSDDWPSSFNALTLMVGSHDLWKYRPRMTYTVSSGTLNLTQPNPRRFWGNIIYLLRCELLLLTTHTYCMWTLLCCRRCSGELISCTSVNVGLQDDSKCCCFKPWSLQ